MKIPSIKQLVICCILIFIAASLTYKQKNEIYLYIVDKLSPMYSDVKTKVKDNISEQKEEAKKK